MGDSQASLSLPIRISAGSRKPGPGTSSTHPALPPGFAGAWSRVGEQGRAQGPQPRHLRAISPGFYAAPTVPVLCSFHEGRYLKTWEISYEIKRVLSLGFGRSGSPGHGGEPSVFWLRGGVSPPCPRLRPLRGKPDCPSPHVTAPAGVLRPVGEINVECLPQHACVALTPLPGLSAPLCCVKMPAGWGRGRERLREALRCEARGRRPWPGGAGAGGEAER